MLLTAHQCLYWPYLGHLSKIQAADLFVLFDATQYDPNCHQNRNRILTKDGPLMLTVPVYHKGYQNGLRICDVKIDNQQPWKRKHLKSIEMAYHKAPYFARYIDDIQAIYQKNWTKLASLDLHILKWCMKQLEIDTPIVRASDYDFQGRKSELVKNMCLDLGASEYIFGPQGKDYCDKQTFDVAGVRVQFQEYEPKEYKQGFPGWVPNLSVLDALLNIGPEAKDLL